MQRAVFSIFLAAGAAVSAVTGTAVGAEVDAQDVLMLKQTVESQQESLSALRFRVAEISSQLIEAKREVDSLRRANNAISRDLVTQEQLKVLAGKLEQVDANRRRDSERLFEALKKIVDTPPAPAPVVSSPPERAPRGPAADSPEGSSTRSESRKPAKAPVELPAESYQHVVKANQTLSEILVAYRKEYGLKTTMAHVEAANPKLNPNRLFVGQTINIPVVK